MSNVIDIEKTIEKIRKSEFVHSAGMPMGYTCGYPLLAIKNNTLCLIIPFIKYKVTGVPDKTMVYPIRFTVTVSLPDESILGYQDLSIAPAFRNVDFNKPIGYFRHKSIMNLNKEEYFSEKKRLLGMYSAMASAVIGDGSFNDEDDREFCRLLNIMIEPSERKIYQVLDHDFYNKYLKDAIEEE